MRHVPEVMLIFQILVQQTAAEKGAISEYVYLIQIQVIQYMIF